MKSCFVLEPGRRDIAISAAHEMPMRLNPTVGMKMLVFQSRPRFGIAARVRTRAHKAKMRGAVSSTCCRKVVRRRAQRQQPKRQVHVVQVRAFGHENDTDEKSCDAGDDGEADQTPERASAVDDEGPDEVELLFDLQRPEMIDTDCLQYERAARPEGEVGRVGQKEILPAVPYEVQRPGKKEKTQKYAIVERKNAQRSACVKSFEEVRAGDGIEQNAGDEKAGERKE